MRAMHSIHRMSLLRSSIMFILVILTLSIVSPAYVQGQSTATIYGWVVEEYGIGTGSGIEGVEVKMYSSDGAYVKSAITSLGGSFFIFLDKGNPGSYVLHFSKKGYAEATKSFSLSFMDESANLGYIVLGRVILYSPILSLVANPGDRPLLPLTVSNMGGKSEIVKLSVSNPEGWFSRILDQAGNEITKIELSSGVSLNLQLEVAVPLAATGDNNLTLTAIGKTNSTLNFVVEVQPFSKSVIFSRSSLTVSRVFWGSSAAPIEVQPGDNNQPLTVVIVNSGTVLAQNVTASLIIESPFSYQYTSGGETIEATNETSSVGTIMPGGNGLAQFTLSIGADSTSGLYKLKMMLYLGDLPIQTTVDLPVRGYSDMALQKASVSPPKVYPGDQNVDLKVFVTNAGNAAAKNVSVEIGQSQYVSPSWGGADSFFIGTVQPGQIVPVDFYIDVDKSAPSPSNHILIAKIAYGPTRNLGKSEKIPLFLSGKSRFVVTSTKIPEIHVSDVGIVILVTLKNIGAEAAQGTRVEIEVPNVFSGTTSDYLGTVEAGEEKTASFVLNIDSNAKIGSYVLNQRMSWSQAGATHLFTQDLSLELNILENPLVKLLPSIIIVLSGAVAAVIIVVAVRRRSRSSKMQPRQT